MPTRGYWSIKMVQLERECAIALSPYKKLVLNTIIQTDACNLGLIVLFIKTINPKLHVSF